MVTVSCTHLIKQKGSGELFHPSALILSPSSFLPPSRPLLLSQTDAGSTKGHEIGEPGRPSDPRAQRLRNSEGGGISVIYAESGEGRSTLSLGPSSPLNLSLGSSYLVGEVI